MKTLLSILFLSIGMAVSAQIANDLEIYTDDGGKFTLYMNGEKINESPTSRVKVENTHHDIVEVKLVMEDGTTTERKRLFINHSAGNAHVSSQIPVVSVYKIINKKGKLKWKLISRSDKKIQRDGDIIHIETDNGNVHRGR